MFISDVSMCWLFGTQSHLVQSDRLSKVEVRVNLSMSAILSLMIYTSIRVKGSWSPATSSHGPTISSLTDQAKLLAKQSVVLLRMCLIGFSVGVSPMLEISGTSDISSSFAHPHKFTLDQFNQVVEDPSWLLVWNSFYFPIYWE